MEMKVVLKYSGNGLFSCGIDFDTEKNNGLYEVPKDTADYLLKTFPNQFTLIEPKVDEKKKTTTNKKRAVKKVSSKD